MGVHEDKIMNGRRLILALVFFSLLFSVVFVLAKPDNVRGQMTIPTRTPVPDNSPPTDTPPDDNGGGDGQESPTNTPAAQNTVAPPTASATSSPATATTGATITQTPTAGSTATASSTGAVSSPASGPLIEAPALGSTPVTFPAVATAFPTAGPCGEPPTFTSLTTANVYLGPGNDYPASDTLGAKEVRPIVGRAAYATWWLIQLDGKFAQAWVSDKAGTVDGYTGNVPIIIAPAINGAFPTPGPQWDPTPAPICTPTPTPTADSPMVSGIIDYSDAVAKAQDAKDVDSVQASSESVQTTEIGSASSEQRGQIAEAASPLEVPSATTPTANLLPIAGLVLVIAAVFVALFLRRSPSRSDPGS
jgi:hypothetical protein